VLKLPKLFFWPWLEKGGSPIVGREVRIPLEEWAFDPGIDAS
jgi:hypothetical protein